MNNENSVVRVGVENFEQLFATAIWPLALDTYQRGFVWNKDKVRQLADDLVKYQEEVEKASDYPDYYMGSILIHEHADRAKQYIIDGQQRLTSLSVLYHNLCDRLPINFALTYSSKSAEHIRQAANIYRTVTKPNAEIFNRITFTVIRVKSVDLAFTFFDTQNNRGVPLHATDLLKAYHLREVGGFNAQHAESLQKICAKRWEGIQQSSPVMSHDQEFTHSLFSKFLWRARYWTGKRVYPVSHDALMQEFQQETFKEKETAPDTIPLYRAHSNRLGASLALTSSGYGEIRGSTISLSPEASTLPFSIRQPIHKGIGFFLYADKYAALLHNLISTPSTELVIINFRKVYQDMVTANSLFLREVFLLASLMYYDQFGHEKLWEFSLRLEQALGAIRIGKARVSYETAQKFIKDPELNFLDVIANSYHPVQVIDFLKRDLSNQAAYESETIETGKGVQGAYKQAVLAYFEKAPMNSLAQKNLWIDHKLKPENSKG